jgi:hypothetical protein
MLGYPDRGLEAALQAVQVARSLNHLQSLDQALSAAALVRLLRGDAEPALVLADEAVAISREQGMRFRLAIAQLMRACALMKISGHLRANVEPLTEGIAQYLATGAGAGFLEFFVATLSKAHQISGNLREAITTMDDARRKARTTWWAAEIHRIEGDLLLAQHQTGQAEHSYWTAIKTAHQQQAASWKLRAGTSLARLWHDQGKRVEARELLFPIYGWFTEGLDTTDLKEAKALLDELG